MALMMGSLYAALVESGASTDAAKRAAEEAAGCGERIDRISSDLATFKRMTICAVALTAAALAKLLV